MRDFILTKIAVVFLSVIIFLDALETVQRVRYAIRYGNSLTRYGFLKENILNKKVTPNQEDIANS